MRTANVVLGALGVGAALAGCGGTVTGVGGGGGASSSGSTSTASSASSTGMGQASSSTSSGISGASSSSGSSGASSSSSSGSVGPCSPTASCPAADKTCIGFVDNTGKTKFGLRMSEVDLTKPTTLATGIVKTTITNAAVLSVPACNLQGGGTFSWLLQFDTAAGTLKTGGAKPVLNPTLGYAFDDEMIQQGANTFHIQPVTYMAKLNGGGAFVTSVGQDLIMPIFINATGTSVILLPLHQARLTGTISASQNCVGVYNAAGLDPMNSCLPDATHPEFIDEGTLDAYLTLAEADDVIVAALNESLCVLLSGNPSMYGMTTSTGVTVCKRDAGNNILFKGTWCAATNMAATATCFDSVSLGGNFAASSILITN